MTQTNSRQPWPQRDTQRLCSAHGDLRACVAVLNFPNARRRFVRAKPGRYRLPPEHAGRVRGKARCVPPLSDSTMFSRFACYFDEVARCGSIRRASETLHIAPSAIDRHILRMEEQLGVPLFERLPQGLRLTAAGELLVDGIRRWRKDFARIKSQVEDLRGFQTGEVSIALVEGAIELASLQLARFSTLYPGIAFNMRVAGAKNVVDWVLEGEVEVGLTFNPPSIHALRLEKSLIFRVGAVVTPGHPLAGRASVNLQECANYPLVAPDESISLRRVLDVAWTRVLGSFPRSIVRASSIGLIKSLVLQGMGIGLLTQIDILNEIEEGTLAFVPLADEGIPLSVLTLITASGRTLSSPASTLIQHLAKAMPLSEGIENHESYEVTR